MTENIGELVAEHPLFSGWPIDVAELVGGCSQNVAIATGQLLLEEGEPARSLFLLRPPPRQQPRARCPWRCRSMSPRASRTLR